MRIAILIFTIFLLCASPNLARAKACPDSPLPRLVVEEQGEVAAGIDRLRLRALPAVGAGVLRTLYAGNQFTILSGPSCNSGYNWWRVEMENGDSGWLAEGEWARYYLAPVSDQPRNLCNSAESPWLYAVLSQICSFLR